MTELLVDTGSRRSGAGRDRSHRRGAAGAALAASSGLLVTWWLVATQAWVGRWDATVVQEAASDRLAWLTPLVLRFTDLAGTTLLPVLVGLAAAVLVGLRRPRAAVALAAALVTSAGAAWAVKTAVARPRPSAALVAGPVEQGFAFPSGHTTAATAVLLVGAALVAGAAGRPLVRRAAWAAAAVGVAGVAGSRVYLGYHWFTDVLAGTFLGAVVAALVLLVCRWDPRDEGRAAGNRRRGPERPLRGPAVLNPGTAGTPHRRSRSPHQAGPQRGRRR